VTTAWTRTTTRARFKKYASYIIVQTPFSDYMIKRNGRTLRDRTGHTRFYVSRNSARKRISRERSSDYHS
jgi:hypothetical protein